MVVLFGLILTSNVTNAQPPAGRKVIIEEYDSQGRRIYRDNQKKKEKKGPKVKVSTENGQTVKTITLGPVLNHPFNPDTIDKEKIVLRVYKKYGRIYVYYKGQFLTAYRCVFGKNLKGQKLFEGDKRTPEGWFTITDVRNHGKWAKFMGIDYPNEQSRKNHAMAKASGKIPQSARIGGSVGIHGVWAGGDAAIKGKFNWTDGCVSLSNPDVRELARIVRPGTRIWIGWAK